MDSIGDKFVSECIAEFRKNSISAMMVGSDQSLDNRKSKITARRCRSIDLLVGSTTLDSCLSTRLTSLSTPNH